MRLSKQERIAVLVIAVIIILGLGIFLFIVPQFKNIGTDTSSLSAKQQELDNAKLRADTRVQLGEDVLKAYKDGQNIADMFFDELKPYQADNEIRNFIQYCKDQGVKCSVDSLTIDSAGVSELGVTFNEEEEITYDLKVAAKGEVQDETDEQRREAILREALANNQAVGSINVSFEVSTLDPDDMMKFIDTINNYKSDGVRKAIRLSSGVEITYNDVKEKYQAVIDDMQLDLTLDALKELADENGKKFPTKDEVKEMLGLDNPTANTDNGDAEGGENQANTTGRDANKVYEIGTDDIYSLEVTLTLYSLERMQDPTDKLAEQDQRLN